MIKSGCPFCKATRHNDSVSGWRGPRGAWIRLECANCGEEFEYQRGADVGAQPCGITDGQVTSYERRRQREV
jgi:hypothetical protein